MKWHHGRSSQDVVTRWTDTACARQIMLQTQYMVTKKERSEKNCFSCLPNTLTIFGWHIYVEVQTILILLLYICGDYIQVKSEPDGHHDLRHGVVDVLRAYGRKVCGIFNARPWWGRLGGQEPLLSHRWCRIRHTQVLVHRAQDLAGKWNAHTA